MAGDDRLTREQQVAKRIGNMNAVLFLDEDVRAQLPHPLMPVNAFRLVFKEYFTAPFKLLPNRVFYWKHAEATGAAAVSTKIVEVTNSVMTN